MKQGSNLKKIVFFSILLCLLSAFSACSADVPPEPSPTPEIETENSTASPAPAPENAPELPTQPEPSIATREDVLFALTHPDDWQIVDVRTYEEWSGEAVSQSGGASGMGRIAGAQHLDWFILRDLPQDEQLTILENLLDGRNIILYCHSGARSTQAMAVFGQLDVTVLNFQGSWIDWSQAVSRSDENDTTFLDFTEAWTDFSP